ncbi:MAG TPA: hypothetical protein VGC41_22310 [Kofleriaceae bacterium]
MKDVDVMTNAIDTEETRALATSDAVRAHALAAGVARRGHLAEGSVDADLDAELVSAGMHGADFELEDSLDENLHDAAFTDIHAAIESLVYETAAHVPVDSTQEVQPIDMIWSCDVPRFERWFVHLRMPLDMPRRPPVNPFEDAVQARLMNLLAMHLRIDPHQPLT